MQKNIDINSSNEKEKQEAESLAQEQGIDLSAAAAEKKELGEKSREEKMIMDELMQEVHVMEQDETKKAQAEAKARKIQVLGEDDKLQHLLAIAKGKGVVEAISVAKKMNEPYILDLLHDILAKEGFYEKFKK